MKLPKRFPTKLILISAAVIGIGAGATIYMAQEHQSDPTTQHKSTQAVSEIEATPETETIEQVAPTTSPEAPQATESIESSTNPTAEAETQEPAPEAPVHAFAAEMTAAGIAEKDFETVDYLVLNPAGWRIIPFEDRKFTWRLARQVQGSLTNKLVLLKGYVDYYYGGDWDKALETAKLRGNF